jgi:hypothetical protein
MATREGKASLAWYVEGVKVRRAAREARREGVTRAQLLAEEAARRRARETRRQAAAVVWGDGDSQTRQRTAMVIAAHLLDEAQEPEAADWLLCARPEHARAVATGVAALALRTGLPAVWDALAAVDAMDAGQAGEWYEEHGFTWSPEPAWLTGGTDD